MGCDVKPVLWPSATCRLTGNCNFKMVAISRIVLLAVNVPSVVAAFHLSCMVLSPAVAAMSVASVVTWV